MKIRLGKWLVMGAALAAIGAGGAGCLTRPVGQQPPTTKVNFTNNVSQQQVDKIDLLLMIDNSASMGDKQAILADAVPQLVEGLLKPKCVTKDDPPKPTGQVADPKGDEKTNYGCPQGSEPEFKPVSDMHIGIVSSSLGSFGGDVCPDSIPRYNDHAHLLNIVKGGQGGVDKAKPSNFLAWFPSNQENTDPVRHPKPANPSADIGAAGSGTTRGTGLIGDFQEMVKGVDQTGCGLEAQLESIYHFLIQPDPWVTVKLDGDNQADFGDDVDVDLLQQRADFLRSDSLVAIIALTDEDDSSADPMSVGGQGWAFMANQFPGSTVFRADGKTTTAPRGTSMCAQNPAETGYQEDGKTPNGKTPCTSCGFAATCNGSDPVCQKIKSDPECQKNGGYYGPTEDQLNVRFHRMKERYGIDPQYPLQRYIDGLTKTKVPDRKSEHVVTVNGGHRQIAGYTQTGKCTNPLFAKVLPRNPGDELCNLPRSTRTADLVFFAVVGGVPHQLLPNVGDQNASVDWKKILGADPNAFNYDGIDPHMIQSVSPRPGLPGPSNTLGDNGTDPIHGREYDTQGDDLQYACTFDLPEQRNCTAQDPSCDCAKKGVFPPLCGPTEGQQIKAKAYPTIREFRVVKALGDQGIIASLCPITLKGDKSAPDYGYNPAVAAIIERLKNALTVQCLPQQLTRDTGSGEVPCLVLATLGDASESCDKYGLALPPPAILDKFREQQKQEQGDVGDAGSLDLTKLPVCEVPQLVVQKGQSCKDDPKIGWCYVENAQPGSGPAGHCPQALIFSSSSGQLSGATFSLQCIQQFNPGEAAGDTDAGK